MPNAVGTATDKVCFEINIIWFHYLTMSNNVATTDKRIFSENFSTKTNKQTNKHYQSTVSQAPLNEHQIFFKKKIGKVEINAPINKT